MSSNIIEVVVVQLLYPTNKMNPQQWVFMDEKEAKAKYDSLLPELPEGCRIHIAKQSVIYTNHILNSQP
mgnify:FL=1